MLLDADDSPDAAARGLVAHALSVSVDRVTSDARIYDLPVWDSLGQLSIVLALEQAIGVRIADPATFDSLTSIRGIAAFLTAFMRRSE